MSKLLDAIIKAVTDVSKTIYEPFTVAEKGSASNLVTTLDLKIEKELKEKLSLILPQAAFLGEEENEKFISDLFFVVDPIDGTSNFTRSLNLITISVGLISGNKPVLGVVFNPFTNQLFYGEKGGGAFLCGKPIYVSDRDFEHSLIFTAFSLYRKEYAAHCSNILNKLYSQCDDFRRLGSAALETSMLAAGCAELYFEMRVYPWDVGASMAILSEAGGYYKSPYADEIDFTKPFPLIAANTQSSLDILCSTVLEEIPKIGQEYYK